MLNSEVLAQRQQRAAFRLLGRRQVFPFRAAYRSEQDGVGLLAAGDGRRRQRAAVAIDGDAADVMLGGGDANVKALTHRVQHFARLSHYFRADAVSGQDGNVISLRHVHTVS